jgi:hypothetical protein
MVCMPEYNKSHTLETRRLLDAPIYELVCGIGTEPDNSQEEMKNDELLARDTKFMALLEQSHSDFKKGYDRLITMRKNSW